MIDHLFGRPSPSWKRTQVFLVVIFWLWRILRGNPGGPRLLWMRRANRALQRYTPWQLIVSTLTGVYAVRNLDKILGLGAPEPLAGLYSPSYYRATWINTGLDAGFATAMSIRPKWLKDLCSVLFSAYYIVYAHEGDEKLRKFRAVPTVEMLRTTWEKTTNPYLRAFTYFPKVTIRRKVCLPRPHDSTYRRPITVWLFFAPPEHHLSRATDLILDIPGGGFISMTPEHHEERLRGWAVRTGKPVLSIDYGKAPEYPYPYAVDECFDAYRVLVESAGLLIGMSGNKFNVILTGDSAGAHIAACVMLKILETQLPVPRPTALVLTYPTLDFNFTSWMTPANLRVLQSEQSSGHIPGLAAQKDHYKHISPLSMVDLHKPIRRRRSWRDALRTLTSPGVEKAGARPRAPALAAGRGAKGSRADARMHATRSAPGADETGELADAEDDADVGDAPEEKPLQARVRFHPHVDEVPIEPEQAQKEAEPPSGSGESLSLSLGVQDTPTQKSAGEVLPLGTRLTMTSRTGYFQDRIISPAMMRAMAILYIGPHRNPEFSSDYYVSPILAPSHLLAQFPPILMSCGEKDPFVDDTVIFAGRIREAKRARRQELDAFLSGRSTKPVEPFRMGRKEGSHDEALRALRRERDLLATQDDEDWATMQIFSEWSHGYLQMPMLMQEARTAINDLADWIDEVFARKNMGASSRRDAAAGASGALGAKRTSPSRHAAKAAPPPPTEDGSTSVTSETELETETDDLLTFLPKKRASPPLSHDDSGTGQKASPLPQSRKDQLSPSLLNGASEHPRNGSLERTDTTEPSVATTESTNSHRFDLLLDVLPQSAPITPNGQKSKRRESSPGLLNRSGTPGKAGQTISESELMRRRRLLDSHLISTDSAK